MALTLATFTLVGAGLYSIRKRHKGKKQAALMAKRKQAAAGRFLSKNDLQSWYKDALDEITEARLDMESSTAAGEPVLMSHYISAGRLQHWVIHTHGYKYELRQTAETEGLKNDEKRYKYNIGVSEYSEAARKQSVLRNYSPEVGPYFYSVIGWTTLSKSQVDKFCKETFDSYGTYNLVFNNCQDFLRRLADKIVTRRAPDWDWFRTHGVSRYKYTDQPKLSDEVIFVESWLRQLKKERTYASGSERGRVEQLIAELENFIRNNLPDRSSDGGDGGHDGGHDSGHDGSHDGGGFGGDGGGLG